MLEIKLSASDEKAVREVIAALSEKQGVNDNEATKILLGWGVATYRQQSAMELRQVAREKAMQEEIELKRTGKLKEVFGIRSTALKTGKETRATVETYLESLSDAELAGTLAEVLTGKTARAKLKTREAKINCIASRVCHGDVFLSR